MFKKLSKVLFSVSLAVLTCGVGLLSLVSFGGGAKASGSNDLSITIEGKTYTLEGNVYGETGAEEVFYQLDTPEDLALVSFMVSVVRDKDWAGYNFEVVNDINLSSRAWTAIGTYDNPYTGKFNGNGFTINGLNASKDACESEVFFTGNELNATVVTLADGNYYYDVVNKIYYQYQNDKANGQVRGLVLQENFDATGKTVVNVTPRNYYYYGLFGNVAGVSANDKAEIADVVMGKGSYAYRNNDKMVEANVEAYVGNDDMEAYSGILVAKADNTRFYNIYDSMADADTKYSAEYYFVTHDEAIDATKTYYTFDSTAKTYKAVETPDLANIATYYEKIFRIDTGLYTYYYKHNTNTLSLYSEETMATNELVVSVELAEGKTGSLIAKDKAYYYDYNSTTGILCLNLKERYIVNSEVTTTDGETTTTVNTIEIDGITYYLRDRAAGGFWLTSADEDPASDAEALFYLTSDTRATGWITLNEKTYPYVYENEVFKVLAFSEVCTLGYVSGTGESNGETVEGCEFFKGNYYRLNSIDYVGIGSIDDNAEHDGILNVLGSTYYYDYDVVDGVNRLVLYSGDYPKYTGLGNDAGVGTIAINGVDYYFDYDFEYKDLDISSVNNHITDIPYTIAETEGSIKVEKLEKGTIFSFNVSTPEGDGLAYYYQKGTTNYITAYRMIYEDGVGLSALDYNSNFVQASTKLPQNYFEAQTNEYYVISDTPGYLFDYWSVPQKDTGVETIVYADKDNELHSYIATTDTVAVADKSYFTYDGTTFTALTVEVGTTDVTGAYEKISTDATVENIKANNYQVNANWTEKSYSVYLDGSSTAQTVGYGMRWDTFISGLTNEGHDLTGVYYYESGVETGTTDSNERVYSYSLNYFYDNYGNLTTYSFIDSADTEIDETKEYYTCSVVGGLATFKLVETPDVANIDTYYEKAENVAIYGNRLSTGQAGISYFMVDWSGNNLYFYTTWQRQPVNGKVSFTNTNDAYLLTTDTVINESKDYYTEADGVFTLVTKPLVENISTYYEKSTKYLINKFTIDQNFETTGFNGVAMTPSIENSKDYFVKLDTEDDRDNGKFEIKFDTATGYVVNYVVPATTGTFAETDINFYTWNELEQILTHTYYDDVSLGVVTDEYDPSATDTKVVLGYWSNATTFIETNGTSDTVHGTGGTNALDSSKIYVDIYSNTTTKDGFAEVYTVEAVDTGTTDDSGNAITENQLIAQATLCRTYSVNSAGEIDEYYTYRQNKFTSNSYKLYIDIVRELKPIKLTVTNSANNPALDYYIESVTIVEDGVALEPIGEIHMISDTNTEETFMYLKYDSNYDILVKPATNYSIHSFAHNNMTAFSSEETALGLRLYTDALTGLSYTVDDQTGDTIGPEYIFTLKESTFDVYTTYNFTDDADGSYRALSGVVIPDTQVQPIYTDGKAYDEHIYAIANGIVNFGSGVNVLISGNSYFNINEVNAYIYTIATNDEGVFLDKISQENVTVVDYDENAYFATVNYKGKNYLVKNDGAQFVVNAGKYSLYDATLYTLKDIDGDGQESAGDLISLGTTSGLNTISAGLIGNNDIVRLEPIVEKKAHAIEALVSGEPETDKKSVKPLRDIAGQVVDEADITSGNIAVVTNTAGNDVETYYYGDTVKLTYTLNDDYYVFKGWYIKIGENIRTIATRNASTGVWTVAENFDSTQTATQYGTVNKSNMTDTTIELTFDKYVPSNVTIYAAFDGKEVSINIGKVRQNLNDSSSKIVLDSLVVNYDGSAENKAYTFSQNNFITGSSFETVKFGNTYDAAHTKSISYSLSAGATMKLLGWAVYDANNNGANLEDRITIIYQYESAITGSGAGTLEINYYDLFMNDSGVNDITVLQNLFNGNSNYYLIPVFEQKTITVSLTNAGGEGESGNVVENLTYYAGGEGLDLSSYSNQFAKVGYTPSGWTSADEAFEYSTTTNTIDLRNLDAEKADLTSKYGGTLTFKRTYTPNKYEIYFDLGAGEELDADVNEAGGDHAYPYVVATYDAGLTLPNAVKTGYTFKGWYIEANGVPTSAEGYFASTWEKYTVDNDVVLVPHFTPNTYKVRLNANGGYIGDVTTKTVDVVYDTTLYNSADIATAPTRDGYTFVAWYAKVGDAVVLIDNADILSVTLNTQANKFVNLEASNGEVLVLVAAWKRVDNYYSLTNSAEGSYNVQYAVNAQSFEAVTAINANGATILTQDNKTSTKITLNNSDEVTFAWAKYDEGTQSYKEVNGGNFTSIALTNVVDSGTYKLTITIKPAESVSLITEVMENEDVITLTREITVTIAPRVILVEELEESYTGTFNGSASPLDASFIENIKENVNIASVDIHSYEVGNYAGETFTKGENAGSYNAIKFYFAFTSGYEYVAGNYAGVGGTENNYYFVQVLGDNAITVDPYTVTLTPVVTKIAYTGTEQTINFATSANVGMQEIKFTANGTLTSGNYGNSDSDTTVTISTTTMNISDKAITTTGLSEAYLSVSNYNYVLSGQINILANVKNYGFSGRILTKDTSDSTSFVLPEATEDEAIVVNKIKLSTGEGDKDFTLNESTLSDDYKVFTMGNITYIYSNDLSTLYFQIENNAAIVNIYSMSDVSSVTLGNENLTYTKDEVKYYLFGIFEVVEEGVVDKAKETLQALTADTVNNLYFTGLTAGTDYYVGYTNLTVVTLGDLNDDGKGSEVRFAKLGSALTYEPSRNGYDFTGWTLRDADGVNVTDENIVVTDEKVITINTARNSIAPVTLYATWQLLAPTVETTNNISRPANEGTDTITATDIITSIVNKNDYLKYTYAWYKGENETALSATDSVTLDANANSNGSYKLVIGIDGSELKTEVPFTVTYNAVEIGISAEGTYTTKTGYFVDGNVALADGKFTYNYSYGNSYEDYIFIKVAGSTAGVEAYNLSTSIDGNIYFEIIKLGETDTKVDSIDNAGTYRIVLKANTDIYSITGTASIEVVVNQAEIELSDSYLRELFGTAEGQEVFVKTFGDGNSILVKTLYIKVGNELYTEKASAGSNAGTMTVTFAGTDEGIRYINGSLEDGSLLGLGSHKITQAYTDNANFVFVLTQDENDYAKIFVNQNESEAMQFRLGAAQTYTYGDTVITSVALYWNETTSKWQLQGFDAENVVKVTWDIASITGLGTSYIDQEVAIKGKYQIAINSTKYPNGFKLAGNYVVADALTVEAVDGAQAILTQAEFVDTVATILTIAKKSITVNSVTKVCDTTTEFNTSVEGSSATIDGLVFGDEVDLIGEFATTAFGTGIAVTKLALVESEIAENYVLSATETTGSITASSITVNITLSEDEFDYGTITETSTLDEIFGFVFGSTEITTLDKSYFTVSGLAVVDTTTEEVVTTYSTGKFLNAGSYKLKFTVASQSFSGANKTMTLEFTVNKITLTPHTSDGSKIEKIYNGNTKVEQTIVIDVLTGDNVVLTAVYDTAAVGERTVTVAFDEVNSNDEGNYVLSTQTLAGEIIAREGIRIIADNDAEAFVEDGQAATYTGSASATVDENGNFVISVTTYNENTEGSAIIAALGIPTRVGYTFGGWYTTEEVAEATKVDASTIIGLINAHLASDNGNEPFAVYAVWTINNYDIDSTTKVNAKSVVTIAANNYNYFTEVTFSVADTTGYDIASVKVYNSTNINAEVTLTDNKDGTYTFVMPAYDVTIETTVSPETYVINPTLNGGTANVPTTHTYGTDTQIPNPTKFGYGFDGWSVNGSVELYKDLTLKGDGYTANITLEARWTANTHRIYFDLGEDESFTQDTITLHNLVLDEAEQSSNKGLYYKEVDFDSTISLPTPVKPGFGFVDWGYGANQSVKLTDGQAYKMDEDVVVTATYQAGTFNITFNATNVTVNVYEGTLSADKIIAGNAGRYALTGGKTYIVEVIADAGYTVDKWTYNGKDYTTAANDFKVVVDATIDITATANENTLTVNINQTDAPNVELTIKVNDVTLSGEDITSITGGIQFKAETDAKVEIAVEVKKGYSLNTPTTSGLNATKAEDENIFTISGFTGNASVSFSLTALSYEIKINGDEAEKVSKLDIYNAQETVEGDGYWTATVTTGLGNLQFVPTVDTGYSFVGVKFGNATIKLDSQQSNIEETGVNISITATGLVTITGYSEAIEVTILTEMDTFDVTLNAIALDAENKENTSITVTLKLNDKAYDADDNAVKYGDAITVSAEVGIIGYRFLGWYLSAETNDDGVVEYKDLMNSNSIYTFEMPSNDVEYIAIFKITNVELDFTVFTNGDYTNVKGGQVLDGEGNSTSEDNPLYKQEVTYTAKANRGYKFVGWYINDALLGEQEASTIGYDVTTVEEDVDGIYESQISFEALDAIDVYAKFEAKPLTVTISKGLLVNGILTYPQGMTYGQIQWGTYANSVFTPDPFGGTTSTISTKTDAVVYVKAAAEEGYLIDQIINTGTGSFTLTEVYKDAEYIIYELSGMNSEDGEYSFIVRYYSSETVITINYTRDTNAVEGGHAEVQSAEGISINANRTSKVVVTAVTNAKVKVRAYTRLGYHFDTNAETGVFVPTIAGTYRGELTEIPTIIPVKLDDISLGYTEYIEFEIDGFAGGFVDISLPVVVSKYTVKLYGVDENLKPLSVAFATQGNVVAGSVISLSATNKNAIKALEPIEGYTLQGFYTYANGSGLKYIDANGDGVLPLNDNGYYWTGAEYKQVPYYTEDVNGNGTFSLFAVYTINKTAISISASPYELKTIAPTVSNKVVFDNLNSANSWTVETDEFYAEVLYGATVNATAPKFEGYKFAFWRVERTDAKGQVLPVRYNENETITDLLESSSSYSYSSIKLTAIYNVHAEVEATTGGGATIHGYAYTINSNMSGITPIEKIVSGEFDFSSLDAIVYKAVPSYGYTFAGWTNEDGQIVSTALEYEVPVNKLQPMYLKATFLGDAKTLKISADSSSIGSIVQVTVNRYNAETEMYEEVDVANYGEFSVTVGEQINIYVNIPDQRYEAVWTGGNVGADLPTEYRKYYYIVAAEDEVSTDIIELKASYVSREFAVTVNYDLLNKATKDEVKIAGKLVYATKEIASGETKHIYYGSAFVMNISVNKNYKVSKILVDGYEIENIEEFTYGGTLRIQTSDYDYMFTQSITIDVEFERVLWYDDIEATYKLSGNGTTENPYKIASEKDLAYVAYMVNVKKDAKFAAASFELTKDLDLTGKYWAPIGTAENAFTGSFDFNVFEITNISVLYGYKGATAYEGLFGVTANANIFRTESNVGLIIGIIAGVLALAGAGVGIFLGLRAKKKRELDKLANS